MKRLAIPLTLTLVFLASRAYSHEDSVETPAPAWPHTAPARAVEINVGTGYNQGFGDISDSEGAIEEEAQNGTAVHFGLGYRLNPSWMIGGYGEGAFYTPNQGSVFDRIHYGASAGVQVQYHFSPFAKLDPWLGVGSGFRSTFIDSRTGGRKTLLGLDLMRVQFGVAYRKSNGWAVSPVVGASFTESFSRYAAGDAGFRAIDDPRPTTFLFAGVINRFDFGGTVVPQPSSVAQRPSHRSASIQRF